MEMNSVFVLKVILGKKEFTMFAAEFLSRIANEEILLPFQYDQIIVLGTVRGIDVQEIRFVTFTQPLFLNDTKI